MFNGKKPEVLLFGAGNSSSALSVDLGCLASYEKSIINLGVKLDLDFKFDKLLQLLKKFLSTETVDHDFPFKVKS